MIDIDKVGVGFLLTIIAAGIFMLGVGLGFTIGQEKQIKEQKTLLIEQNKLLKEHIALQNEMLKLKEVAE